MREIKKWGFGAAPFKRTTEIKNRKSLVTLRKIISSESIVPETVPEAISHVKGMFNRIIKQDQWDWFTTNMFFDYPNLDETRYIIIVLTDLRKAFTEGNEDKIEYNRLRLRKTNILQYIENYLNFDVENEKEEFVYILSRKEEKEILKIGMTKRNVLIRCYEINSATGVLYPFSPRRVFRVNNASISEKIVHEALAEWRIRNDREFFKIDYSTAVKIIEKQLNDHDLIYEKYSFNQIEKNT